MFRIIFPIALILLTPVVHAQIDTIAMDVPVHNATISATLFRPHGLRNVPVVILIAGSGPTDRDGNSPLLQGKNNSLLLIADTLVRQGIACLRYDKRGIGKSRMAAGIKEDSTLFSDMVDDARALFETLKKNGFTRIYVAGHSEGSLVGLALCNLVNPDGFISIAGAGRKAPDILKEQLNILPAGLRDESFAAVDSLSNGMRVKKVNPALISLLRPSVQPYLISWFAYDPAALMHSLQCPALILQGTHDLQVKETDARALAAARPEAKLVIIPNMNHVLKEVISTDTEENVKAYSDPSLPVMKELTDEIINFITKRSNPY